MTMRESEVDRIMAAMQAAFDAHAAEPLKERRYQATRVLMRETRLCSPVARLNIMARFVRVPKQDLDLTSK